MGIQEVEVMNLYRRTLAGYLETHNLETAGHLLSDDSVIYTDNPDDKEMLEGMRLIVGCNYKVKRSCDYLRIHAWEWFTYNPRKHH